MKKVTFQGIINYYLPRSLHPLHPYTSIITKILIEWYFHSTVDLQIAFALPRT